MSEKIDLNILTSVSYNPRIISTENLERLKSSIKKHTTAIPNSEGYRLTTTVTINKNGNRIIGGHQRIKALKSLGQDWIHINDITWVDVEPDSIKEKELNLILNSEKVQGEWDQSKLDNTLKDICVDNKELFIDLDLAPIQLEMTDVGDEIDQDLEEEYDIPSQINDIIKVEEIVVKDENVNNIQNKASNVEVEQKSNDIKISSLNNSDVKDENINNIQNKELFVNKDPDIEVDVDQDEENVDIPIKNVVSEIKINENTNTISISYVVTDKQKTFINNAIDKAKVSFDDNSVSNVLTMICKEWFNKEIN